VRSKFNSIFILVIAITFFPISFLFAQDVADPGVASDTTAIEEKEARFDPYPPVKEEDLQRSFFRKLLNKITVSGYVGYGRTFYKQNLDNYAMYTYGSGLRITPVSDLGGGGTAQNWSNWLTFPVPDTTTSIGAATFALHPDSVKVGLKGSGGHIPIGLSLHYEFLRYRLGIGFAMEPHTLNRLKPKEFRDQLGDYEPDFGLVNYKRLYVYGGATVLSFPFLNVVADLQVGKVFMPAKKYDKTYLRNGLYLNVGATIEQRFSEYFRVYARPSLDFKGYTMTGDGLNVKTSQRAFSITFGVMINYPLYKRCPINSKSKPPNKSCKVQVEHYHNGGGKVYRGQPITKWQNPKAGQNHRKLIRYKWKNRNKLNPY